MSQDKSQEATAEGAGPNQLPSPKAEPMEMDVQYTSDAPSEAVLQSMHLSLDQRQLAPIDIFKLILLGFLPHSFGTGNAQVTENE